MTAPAVASMGAAARRALRPGASLEVVAVFARCVYLAGHAGELACLGDASLGAGPLNVTCTGPWPGAAFGRGAKGHCARGALTISGVRVRDDRATDWRPPRLRSEVGATHLARAIPWLLEALDAGAGGLAPAGLAALVLAPCGVRAGRAHPVLDAAREPVADLRRWLRGERPEPAGATALVGLGPGLTPSGDDLLGAALVTLRATGDGARADVLARATLARALHATGPISRAHLVCAAAGAGSERLHDLLVALTLGHENTVRGAARRLGRLGHSSGRDMLAGVCCVLDAGRRRRVRHGRR